MIPYAQALAVAGGGGEPTAEGGFRSDVLLECGISAAAPFYGMGGAGAAPAAAGAARRGVPQTAHEVAAGSFSRVHRWHAHAAGGGGGGGGASTV